MLCVSLNWQKLIRHILFFECITEVLWLQSRTRVYVAAVGVLVPQELLKDLSSSRYPLTLTQTSLNFSSCEECVHWNRFTQVCVYGCLGRGGVNMSRHCVSILNKAIHCKKWEVVSTKVVVISVSLKLIISLDTFCFQWKNFSFQGNWLYKLTEVQCVW